MKLSKLIEIQRVLFIYLCRKHLPGWYFEAGGCVAELCARQERSEVSEGDEGVALCGQGYASTGGRNAPDYSPGSPKDRSDSSFPHIIYVTYIEFILDSSGIDSIHHHNAAVSA